MLLMQIWAKPCGFAHIKSFMNWVRDVLVVDNFNVNALVLFNGSRLDKGS